jgi:hypothetical protein
MMLTSNLKCILQQPTSVVTVYTLTSVHRAAALVLKQLHQLLLSDADEHPHVRAAAATGWLTITTSTTH